MGNEGEVVDKEYAKFQEKVKNSIYLDNLAPSVNEAVIRTAFDHIGTVKSIQFIPNYTHPYYNPMCALVEFGDEKEAEVVLDLISTYPFMMSGKPRPVRGRPAEPEMFSNRPGKPGTKIQLRWLDRSDPDFFVGQKLKRLTKQHNAEQTLLLKKQMQMEEKLSKQQAQTLKENTEKYRRTNSVFVDGTAASLGKHLGVHIPDEGRPFDF